MKRWQDNALLALSPTIIKLLDQLLMPDLLDSSEKENAAMTAQNILGRWEENEDINELRQLLGVNFPRGGRRKYKTAVFEFHIATAVQARIESGLSENAAQAKDTIAGEYDLDIRKVERYYKDWKNDAVTFMSYKSMTVNRDSVS